MSSPSGKNVVWRWPGVILLLCALIAGIWFIAWQKTAPGPAFLVAPFMKAGARIFVIAVAIVAWFWTQSLIGCRRSAGNEIGDALHDLSRPWNEYLHGHPRLSKWLLIVSSLFIDIFGLYLIGAGIFGQTLKPFIALLIVFAFRQLCQALCALPAPPKMIWYDPGFPSLLVTYGVANDFYISGHTAIAVLGAIEASQLLPWWCALIAGTIALLEAAMVIVLRAHYTMDVLAAIVAACCAAGLANWLCLLFGL